MAASAALDRGCDVGRVYEECARAGLPAADPAAQDQGGEGRQAPAALLRTRRVDPSPARTASAKRQSGAAPPASASPPRLGIKAARLHPLIPRDTERWQAAYRKRAAVEREFGHQKTEWG